MAGQRKKNDGWWIKQLDEKNRCIVRWIHYF